MRVIFDLADWDGSLPAVLVVPVRSVAERRGFLRRLVAHTLRVPVNAVEVAHQDGLPACLVRPAEGRLRLSSASRGGLAALAVAFGPLGVDVEQVDPGRDMPINVLHRREVAYLLSLPPEDCPRAFARLWTCKEAYVKALGLGFSRDPASFEVKFLNEERAAIDDPETGLSGVRARTIWRTESARAFAISAVALGPEPDRLRPVAT